MFKRLSKVDQLMRKIHHPIEYNMGPYRELLGQIHQVKLENLENHQLKNMAVSLKQKSKNEKLRDELLVEVYALVAETARRVLGIVPYDVQIMGAIALHRNKIVEMQTGEGKTLTAVFPAILNALEGKGVHILTFNDYLAQRDASWMAPLCEFLDITVSCIQEGMDSRARQKAYGADITYVTAKEAGFDYLRDFLCIEKEKIIHRPFHYAIVDEADSILIDEARIPLVLAGNIKGHGCDVIDLWRTIKPLRRGDHYEIDGYEKSVFLTEEGISHVEELLKCGNLYDLENLEILTQLHGLLHAKELLQKDRDYIVRNGKIEIVDEFTGRIADKRHWPDTLQRAVEVKEGIGFQSKGVIMGSIALQNFLGLYPKIAGMTGTAQPAATEFKEFYGMDVVVVPTNRPCIRKDYPDKIFAHKVAKEKALILEIHRIHRTGQPILIGTDSVEASEKLGLKLKALGIHCEILNAKNDTMEAEIIAKAGEIGAVTVSTNMAGRGIDIKLGGVEGRDRDRVVALGGLYIIGTTHHESRRIDDQLRGRAGRQGDPGESCFFISFEDDIVNKYNLYQWIDSSRHLHGQEDSLDSPSVRRAMDKAQRMIEGYNSDVRRQLWKYTFIMEQQRKILHARRQMILMDEVELELFRTKAAQRYTLLKDQWGSEVLQRAEKQITLYCINKCWAEYLDYMGYIRESIHLVVMGNENPLNEFHRIAIEAFEQMLGQIHEEVIEIFYRVKITEKGLDLEEEGLQGPSSTWTYLISDSPDQFSNLPILVKGAKAAISKSTNKLWAIYKAAFKTPK